MIARRHILRAPTSRTVFLFVENLLNNACTSISSYPELNNVSCRVEILAISKTKCLNRGEISNQYVT